MDRKFCSVCTSQSTLIIKKLYLYLHGWVIYSCTVDMKEEIYYGDQRCCSYQAVNMLICKVKLGIFTWLAKGILAIRGPAIFGTWTLASFFSSVGCYCDVVDVAYYVANMLVGKHIYFCFSVRSSHRLFSSLLLWVKTHCPRKESGNMQGKVFV